MIINHNMNAMNSHRQMGINVGNAGKAMEKLSSGLRINRAGDDAAGLAISEKMRGQIRGLDQASRNAQDGISLIQTAEGALNETHSILQRMRELAVQSSNDTNVKVDRAAIQDEMNALTEEIDRISRDTEFNTQSLLNGSFKGKFQIGANENQVIDISINKMDSSSLGLTSTSTKVEELAGTPAGTGFKGDGKYTVKGTDVLNEKGEIVGKVSGKDITLGDATNNIKITSKEDIKDGIEFTLKGKDATIKHSGDLSDKGKELAAGNYEIKGDVVLRDGKEVGTFDGTGKEITIGETKVKAADLGLTEDLADGAKFSINGADISSADKATGSIKTINTAIETVSTQRSKLGAVQNRLEHTINNLNTSSENLQAAESRVRDVDMAKEMMTFSKNNILQQAAQAMLAQANQQPQGVLQLLR
ncbi:flagellin [Clostridium rectalis]|uniref:flagellin N-terminal helical domain-containing protein n=1 Tax=Clostridium rectalis TaxID=2040295 RepID=UPI000F63CAB4|nr:flagellin [Clostridium rectalis]